MRAISILFALSACSGGPRGDGAPLAAHLDAMDVRLAGLREAAQAHAEGVGAAQNLREVADEEDRHREDLTQRVDALVVAIEGMRTCVDEDGTTLDVEPMREAAESSQAEIARHDGAMEVAPYLLDALDEERAYDDSIGAHFDRLSSSCDANRAGADATDCETTPDLRL